MKKKKKELLEEQIKSKSRLLPATLKMPEGHRQQTASSHNYFVDNVIYSI